jgi:ATPase subunit of ABC transporter with duplicated ATPase domains
MGEDHAAVAARTHDRSVRGLSGQHAEARLVHQADVIRKTLMRFSSVRRCCTKSQPATSARRSRLPSTYSMRVTRGRSRSLALVRAALAPPARLGERSWLLDVPMTSSRYTALHEKRINEHTAVHLRDEGLRKVVPPNREILKGIWLSFYPGAKIGVVGPNGSGKSSLLRIMAGVDTDFQGEAWAAKGTRIGYLPQEPAARSRAERARQRRGGVSRSRDLLRRFDEVNMKFAEPMSDDEMQALIDEQGEAAGPIDASNAWDLDRKIEIAMDALRLPPADADVTTLSGGERRRVALCKVLLEEPDMLLLDEPTNHLDAESVAWLERFLADFPGTVVAITHDRYFLDNVAKWILELDRGAGRAVGGQLLVLARAEAGAPRAGGEAGVARQRSLQRELEWIRMAPRARQSKGKARITAYEDLLNQDQREKLTAPRS